MGTCTDKRYAEQQVHWWWQIFLCFGGHQEHRSCFIGIRRRSMALGTDKFKVDNDILGRHSGRRDVCPAHHLVSCISCCHCAEVEN